MNLLASLFGSGRGAYALDDIAWRTVIALPVFDRLDAQEKIRLHELAIRLLADKAFSGAGGLQMEGAMATTIAAFAALPVLHLGAEWENGVRSSIAASAHHHLHLRAVMLDLTPLCEFIEANLQQKLDLTVICVREKA